MTTEPRPRFSARVGLAAAPVHDGPFEDVPKHLLEPLRGWVEAALTYQGREREEARNICLRLRMTTSPNRYGSPQYLPPLTQATGAQLLDVVDEMLRRPEAADPIEVNALAQMLDDAGSAYRVNEHGDGLEERVTPAVRDAVRQTIAGAATKPSAGSAADHLATAWQAAYGRGPDPVRAYGEAIKAVECAAHSTIQPNNAKATLGTMLGEFKNARHKFTAVIPSPAGDPIAPAEAMMRALWDGQTSRHGAQTTTVPETLEAARAGVHLAAALVQWFVSGAVVHTP
ncbi:hypothetical protein ABZ695_27110 [Streptomyces sp. NPDC006976]|uniref:hypothetical protein n=1 Tax=Streptomyces sp. NPDC006976 TaxID=3154311 RepID=UPI003407FE96